MEKKKTFKELFAGTGIEPTTDENGGVHYNFNATLNKEPMKTAMQELIEHIQVNATKFSLMNTYNILKEIEPALEKEKQQIIDACNANLKGLLTNGKDYYDLNFNHHIESEPNTYTNFTPHNANAVAEYNEGLKNFTPNK